MKLVAAKMFNTSGPKIMGILNVTPDSFSDGGRFTGIDQALRHAESMIADGVDLIDVGGESTRPGALPVSADEQIRRVIPAITAIRQMHSTIPISIDTCLSSVAAAAISAGASIINDVSAGSIDTAILGLAAETKAYLILMHMQGQPQTMQEQPYYENAVAEVKYALQERIADALAAGVQAGKILIDPGIGFGKRKQDNLDLLAHLQEYVELGYPVLLGTSRKRFMGGICNISEPAELDTVTAVTTALGVMAGVRLFRVHNVKANRQAADIAWAIKQAQ